jgi:hypothetical protein
MESKKLAVPAVVSAEIQGLSCQIERWRNTRPYPVAFSAPLAGAMNEQSKAGYGRSWGAFHGSGSIVVHKQARPLYWRFQGQACLLHKRGPLSGAVLYRAVESGSGRPLPLVAGYHAAFPAQMPELSLTLILG